MTTHYPPQQLTPLPAGLASELSRSYSVALYGAPDRLNISTMRVLWPTGVSVSGRSHLRDAIHCGTPTRRSALPRGGRPRLYVDNLYTFLNTLAIWVQQAPERVLEPARSQEWIEVAHCFYFSWPEKTHHGTPIHFFHTPGSGLSVNVGRTIVLQQEDYGWQQVQRAHRFFNNRATAALARNTSTLLGQLRTLLRSPSIVGVDMEGKPTDVHTPIDSIQFAGAQNRNWGSERFTEVVMLQVLLPAACPIYPPSAACMLAARLPECRARACLV